MLDMDTKGARPAIVAYQMFNRLVSLFSKPKIQYIVVTYDKKEYRITFTPEDYTDGSVSVGSLRSMLGKQFKVPVTHLNLFVLQPQRRMSNNKAYLEDYGLANGGSVLAVFKTGVAADTTLVNESSKASTATQTPQEQLDSVRKAVETDLGTARIKAFINAPPKDAKARDKEYRLLNEVILQNTIKLDNIDVSGSPELRQQRKSMINDFHRYHTDIDAANEKAAAAPEAPAPAEGAAPAGSSPSPSPKPAGGKRKRKNKKK